MYSGRREQMFPRLSPAQVARLAQVGHRRQVEIGEVVAEQGDATPSFFVVISGALAIVHPEGGHELPISILREGEFTGEVNMLSARPSLVRARIRESGELLAITPDALRKVVQADAERGLLLVRGAVPGPAGGLVMVRSAVKTPATKGA